MSNKIHFGDIALLIDQIPVLCHFDVEDDDFYFVDNNGNSVSKKARVIGKVIGYAPATDLNKEKIEFRRI